MIPPVALYGNVLHVVRGETVALEVLGSGDASVAWPSFKLKKKPLTYRSDGSASDGRRSSLSVRVNGILWREVPSFFGVGLDDTAYIVRQDENGDSFVTFIKLPTGADNVTASYRFGAGLAKPPAGALTQIVRPVQGLARVLNPVPAFGGADADSIADIRVNAPDSALTLGRAVSLADFEALARGFGAVNVSAGWAWDPSRQRAMVKLWYISDDGDIAKPLRKFLIAQADPNVPLVVSPAVPVSTVVVLDISADQTHTLADVQSALIAALSDPDTGPFSHRNVPIGGTIFRSEIFAAAMAVAGIGAINGMTVNGAPAPVALTADEGTFLDFLPFANG
jgi:predicted phage baseplate assembly protein